MKVFHLILVLLGISQVEAMSETAKACKPFKTQSTFRYVNCLKSSKLHARRSANIKQIGKPVTMELLEQMEKKRLNAPKF